MDTREFLKTILPDNGVYMMAVMTDKGLRHRAFNSVDSAADFALQCDEQGATVYHACAAYQKAPFKDESGKYVARKPCNWRAAKSFWVDIDCGENKAAEGKGYATQRDAAQALVGWYSKYGLPDPLLVSSGRGLHAYWCLENEVPAQQWCVVASGLKSVMMRDGFHGDPTRTADFSSVLRPVGTHNRKDAEHPKAVRALFVPTKAISNEEFFAKVSEMAGVGFDLGAAPEWMQTTDGNADLMESYSVMPCSAEACADKCKQLAQVRDTQGDVGYEHWRGAIGIIKHCKEGIKLAEHWTEKRAETGHAQVDVQVRFETWDSPPPTCAFFEKNNPSGCNDCPYKGKIKTPWVLGREEPVQEETTVEVEQTDASGATTAVQYQIPSPPPGYGWDGHRLVAYRKNADNVLQAFPFCSTQFYLLRRLRTADGSYAFDARAHFPRGEVKEFSIPGALIGSGGNKLMEILGQYEIMVMNYQTAPKDMQGYLKAEVDRLVSSTTAVNTYTHFGWQENGGFLIGSRLYTPDGKTTEVLVSGGAAESVKVFPSPRGSVASYATKINTIYNRPGMEPMQYMICSLWAAPLVALCDSMYNGIPCVLTGTQSGKGKTTAALAALLAYGRAMPGMAFSGREGATTNAQATFIGTLRNLPVLLDEVTNKSARELSDLCYALSSGVEKMRLRTSGGKTGFNERHEWRTHTALTGNTQITARLSTNGDTEAEVMRIFEINIDRYDIPSLDPLAVSTMVSSMEEDMGSAGEAFVKYVVAHRDAVRGMLFETYNALKTDADLVSQPRYRFYRNHIVCTLTCAKIMKSLGVIEFDIDAMTTFALEAVRELFYRTNEGNVLTAKDALGLMLNEFAPKIIQTERYIAYSNEPLTQVKCPQGIVGRAVCGASDSRKDKYNNRLMVSSAAIRDWCVTNRMSIDYLASCLKKSGVLLERRFSASLGRGTTAPTAQCRCWLLDLEAINKQDSDTDTDTEVENKDEQEADA